MESKKILKIILSSILLILVLIVFVFCGLYFTRFKTIGSIEKLTDYEDGYDLYKIDIRYDYDLDNMMKRSLNSDDDVKDAILGEAIPYLPIHMKSFWCSF